MTDEPEDRRKPKREKRDKWLPKMRVTQNELCAYKSKADAAGMTLSEFVRYTLESAVVLVRDPVGDVALIRQMAAIGNNLNQLTRSANIEGWLDPFQIAELEELNAMIRKSLAVLTDSR